MHDASGRQLQMQAELAQVAKSVLAPVLRSNLICGEPPDFAQDGVGAERLGQSWRRAKSFGQRGAIIAGDKEERPGPVRKQFGDGIAMIAMEIDVEQGDVDVVERKSTRLNS